MFLNRRIRNSPDRMGPREWLRICILIGVIAALTWYGKFHTVKREAVRVHGTAVWILPTPQGLSSLLVLHDDGIDSNAIKTGLRLWFLPPKHPLRFEADNPAIYRSPSLVLVGDSIADTTIAEARQMHDSAGSLRTMETQTLSSALDWLSKAAGSDAQVDMQNGRALLTWNGYRIAWWKNAARARLDSLSKPVSLGIIAECILSTDTIPHAQNHRVKTLVYCGTTSIQDSTRINLTGDNAGFVLIEDQKENMLFGKRVHLKWQVEITRDASNDIPSE